MPRGLPHPVFLLPSGVLEGFLDPSEGGFLSVFFQIIVKQRFIYFQRFFCYKTIILFGGKKNVRTFASAKQDGNPLRKSKWELIIRKIIVSDTDFQNNTLL